MTTVRDKTHQDLPDLSDRDALPSWSPPISRVAPFDTSDLEELMRDYFRWLRDDWQLPTYPSPGSIISVPPRPLPLLPERSYSVHELALLWDVRIRRISRDIKRYHIHPIGKRGKAYLYRGKDTAPIWSHVDWIALWNQMRAYWEPFIPPGCGVCSTCREGTSHRINCFKHWILKDCYTSLHRFLRAVQFYGSVQAWWQHERLSVIRRQPRSVMV